MCSWQATEEYKEKKNMGCGQDQVYRDKCNEKPDGILDGGTKIKHGHFVK